MPRFERRLGRRNPVLGGGIGRGAEPPSEQIVRGLCPRNSFLREVSEGAVEAPAEGGWGA